MSRTWLCLVIIMGSVWIHGREKPTLLKGAEEPPVQAGEQAAIRRAVTLVDFNLQVRTGDEGVVTGLRPENFRVYEDGQPQTIRFFEPDNAPVVVVLMVEFSRATAALIPDIRESAMEMMRLLRPDDYCALVVFNNRAIIVEDFTRNKAEILRHLGTMDYTFKSGVELLESVAFVVDRMAGVAGKKGVVLLASGLTTGTSREKNLLRRLRVEGVPIFPVSVSHQVRHTGGPLSNDIHARLFQADHRLRELADNSGGMAFFPRHPAAYPGVMAGVGTVLRHQYLLAYAPPEPDNLDKKRSLRIEAEADVDGDGRPDSLKVIHVEQYQLVKDLPVGGNR